MQRGTLGVVIAMLCASCGRFGFDAEEADSDAPTADAANPDAAAADARPTGLATVTGARLITPPPSVVSGELESDTEAVVFVEIESLLLTEPLPVTFRSPGIYDTGFGSTDPTPIPAGTRVTSVFVHADKVGSTMVLVDYNVGLSFHDPIVGVIAGSQLRAESDDVVGVPTTDYPAGGSLDSPEDTLTLGPDLMSISLLLRVDTAIDQVRILVLAP